MTQKTDVLNSSLLNKILTYFVLIKALSYERAFSQQIIANGDFTYVAPCPEFWSQKAKDFSIPFWWSANEGSPDYFNDCSTQCGSKKNWMGGTKNEELKPYIGIVLQSFNKNAVLNYREYVQTKLNQKLNLGSHYTLSLEVYFPSECGFITSDFGALFSNSAIKSTTQGILNVAHYTPYFFTFEEIIPEKWISLNYTFCAQGTEQFLTLGNFFYQSKDPIKTNGSHALSYLFIKKVSLNIVTKNDSHQNQIDKAFITNNYSYASMLSHTKSSSQYLDTIHETKTIYSGICSCFNCLMNRGEIDASITQLDSTFNYEISEGQRFDLNNIVFDYLSGALLPESKLFLNKLIFILSEFENIDLRFVIFTYPSNALGEDIARETALNLYHILRKNGINNKISFIHDTKTSLTRTDGKQSDRSIELQIVKIH